MTTIDWAIVISFLIIWVFIGALVAKRAGRSSTEYFLSGRSMPWWLLGVSMVATTFSTDTPNLVTDIVRTKGVAGNWMWWAFLLTGMLTTFIFARLWRRSNVTTDIEFYELRYSGRLATFLRGFRAIYLGVFFNVVIIATVSLAAIKIGGVMVGAKPEHTLLVCGGITALYAMMGGLTSVIITDLIQFCMAMFGAIVAAVYALNRPEVGGISNLVNHPELAGKLSILPDFNNMELATAVFIIPLAVQWWSSWYPGAEPGGGGYVAQRMLAAKNEKHSQGATLLFNILHYGVRPWPWIIVALCSLLVYPDLDSLREAFPNISEQYLKDDIAYSAMLVFLPPVLIGIVVSSLAAAYMSTISTHLNWGSSYVVNDVYVRFIKPEATQKEQVLIGRISTIALMVFGGYVALSMQNAQETFFILLQIGAGTGLLFILRWFWWRINPFSELTAMIVSMCVAFYFAKIYTGALSDSYRLLVGVLITTCSWIFVTLVTQPSDEKTLRSFYAKTRPGGPGWKAVLERAKQDNDPVAHVPAGVNFPISLLCMLLGCGAVWSALFSVGYYLYGQVMLGAMLSVVAIVCTIGIFLAWQNLETKTEDTATNE